MTYLIVPIKCTLVSCIMIFSKVNAFGLYVIVDYIHYG